MKIFGGFIFFIFSVFQLHANDFAIIEEDNRKGLADNKGRVIIPPIYDDLGWSEGSTEVVEDVIGYKQGELWGLINTKNIKVTPADFIRIIPYDNHLLIASKPDSYKLNEMFGLVTVSGKTVLDFDYTHLQKGIQGLIAGVRRNNRYLFGILDTRGNQLAPFRYKSIRIVSDQIYSLQDFDNKLVLVNPDGKTILNQMIDEIYPYKGNLLVFEQEGRKGLLKSDGSLLSAARFSALRQDSEENLEALPQTSWHVVDFSNTRQHSFEYDEIKPLEKSLYKTCRSDYSFIIEDKGEIIFSIRNSEIEVLNDSLAAITKDGKKGVIDYKGQMVIQPEYDSIRIGGDNLFLYQRKGMMKGWKIHDLSGNLLSVENYDKIHPVNNRYHAVLKNDFWGITDRKGREMIPPIYDRIYDVSNSFFLVGFHGEKGVVDIGGNWISLPREGDLYLLEDERYLISSFYGSSVISLEGKEQYKSENYLRPVFDSFIEEDYRHKMGLLNKKYIQILPVAYDTVMALIDDSVFLFRNEKGWGAVDNAGKILFKDDMRFQDIVGCNEEYIGVQIDGEYGFVDLLGRLRIANRYEGISLYHEGIANIRILGKWGCINKKEVIVVQPYYEEIQPFRNGFAIARKDGKYGLVDHLGMVKVPFEYDRIERMSNGSFITYLNGKSGLVDRNGMLVFHTKYDLLEDLQNEHVLVRRKEKFGLMSSEGVIIIPIIYDHMLYDPINEVMLVSNDPKWEKFDLSSIP